MSAHSRRNSASRLLTLLMAAVPTTQALAADIELVPPAGGGVVVKGNGGSTDHLRVDATGAVSLPAVPAATEQERILCINQSSGALGPCAASAITGPTGPTGPGYGQASYGSFYLLAAASENVIPEYSDIPFTDTELSASIALPPGSQIVVENGGIYKVEYSIHYSSGGGSEIAVTINGSPQASTKISLPSGGSVHGTALLALEAGQIVGLRNMSGNPITLVPSPSQGARLVLTQIR